ncbi:MAG: PD40 domain-containing protein, partial [Chloroflexi bacterium]|nr:PD40 domain-containing protein [Chloroflexota bacterium]
MMYRHRRPSAAPQLILLALAGILIGLAMAAFFGLPRVLAVSPQGGSASSRAPVTLSFNHPMDHASVESRLSIQPPSAGAVSWSGNELRFTPDGTWPPGTVTVSLALGGKTSRGLPMLFGRSWSFTVGAARVAFLLKTDDIANVWAVPAEGGAAAQLTSEAAGVDDFVVSPDGTQIVYAALRPDGGADLRRTSRDGGPATTVLACHTDLCSAPQFSADGAQLAFERSPVQPDGRIGDPKVQVLDPASGQLTIPAQDPAHTTRSPRFAADGRLAYLDSTLQAIAVFDFASRTATYIPNTSGEMGTWSPDGNFIVYPEIVFPPEPTPAPTATGAIPQTPTAEPENSDRFYSNLLRVTVSTNKADDLSGSNLVEDASPVYSPDGQWLAFARKQLVQNQWTPGRQLWLMRADGQDARALTSDPFDNHSAFVWSPDSARLVYMRFNVAALSELPTVWIIDISGAGETELAPGGYLPEWIP